MTWAATRSTCTRMTWLRTWARRAGSRARCSDHLVDHIPREIGAAFPAELGRAKDAAAVQVGREIGVACHRLERLTPGLGTVGGRGQAPGAPPPPQARP